MPRLVLLACLVLGLTAGPATAWKGKLEARVTPIAEVHDRAESGDHVVVEGEVRDVRSGQGSLVIARIEDDSGWVYVAVPEHLRRHFDGDKRRIRRVRVAGQWDHKHMDEGTWGIRAQKIEVVDD